MDHPSWKPDLAGVDGPVYLAIADALEADIGAGKVQPGTRLPAQRALAETLGIDFTTVGRAFAEARRRGLIEATVGRGSFARKPLSAGADSQSPVDMTMNLPPLPASLDLKGRIEHGMKEVLARPDFATHLTYRQAAGAESDRAAGIDWLTPRLPHLNADHLLVASGAQTALAACLSTLLRPGDLILGEALSYPGLPLAARQLGLTLRGVAIDDQGLIPEALEDACRRFQPKALYCVPVLHSPTTATQSLARRQAIVEIARRHDLRIIEDDTYGLLMREAPPPLTTLAPERSFYIGGLAKVLTPMLRVAYLVAPDATWAARLTTALRALTGMAPPLMVALASHWIRSGEASEILTALRQEAMARQRLAADLLPPDLVQTAAEAHHLWLRLPASWPRDVFVARLQRHGLALVPSDAFLATPDLTAPNAVRLCLGAAADQRLLHHSLAVLAATLAEPVEIPAAVV